MRGSQEAIDFGFLWMDVSVALFLISFMEESAPHPTSGFPEAGCPKLYCESKNYDTYESKVSEQIQDNIKMIRF